MRAPASGGHEHACRVAPQRQHLAGRPPPRGAPASAACRVVPAVGALLRGWFVGLAAGGAPAPPRGCPPRLPLRDAPGTTACLHALSPPPAPAAPSRRRSSRRGRGGARRPSAPCLRPGCPLRGQTRKRPSRAHARTRAPGKGHARLWEAPRAAPPRTALVSPRRGACLSWVHFTWPASSTRGQRAPVRRRGCRRAAGRNKTEPTRTRAPRATKPRLCGRPRRAHYCCRRARAPCQRTRIKRRILGAP